jgi:hypothetical protein
MRTDVALYVRDLFYLLREAAADAEREKHSRSGDATYHEGRQMAYVEVLLLMQSQADAFMIPREELGMNGFDPLKDPLQPPDASRNQ